MLKILSFVDQRHIDHYNLYDINCCLDMVFLLFPNIKVNLNIGISIFLIMASSQNLVLAPGAPIRVR